MQACIDYNCCNVEFVRICFKTCLSEVDLDLWSVKCLFPCCLPTLVVMSALQSVVHNFVCQFLLEDNHSLVLWEHQRNASLLSRVVFDHAFVKWSVVLKMNSGSLCISTDFVTILICFVASKCNPLETDHAPSLLSNYSTLSTEPQTTALPTHHHSRLSRTAIVSVKSSKKGFSLLHQVVHHMLLLQWEAEMFSTKVYPSSYLKHS